MMFFNNGELVHHQEFIVLRVFEIDQPAAVAPEPIAIALMKEASAPGPSWTESGPLPSWELSPPPAVPASIRSTRFFNLRVSALGS